MKKEKRRFVFVTFIHLIPGPFLSFLRVNIGRFIFIYLFFIGRWEHLIDSCTFLASVLWSFFSPAPGIDVITMPKKKPERRLSFCFCHINFVQRTCCNAYMKTMVKNEHPCSSRIFVAALVQIS